MKSSITDGRFSYFWDVLPMSAVWLLGELEIVPKSLPSLLFFICALWLLNKMLMRQDALAARQKRLAQLLHYLHPDTSRAAFEDGLGSDSFSENL
jgi:hypothetical protein